MSAYGKFSIVGVPLGSAQYVSLLGTASEKWAGADTPPNEKIFGITATVASVTMATNESIFIAISGNWDQRISGAVDGWVVSDNLGNTYTWAQVPYKRDVLFQDQDLWLGLAMTNPSVAGILTSITVTFPKGAWYVAAMVAGRFRYIGSPEASTQETASGDNNSNGNDAILTQASLSSSIGIAARVSETGEGQMSYQSPSANVGFVRTTGGGDSSNVSLALGYCSPVTAAGMLATHNGFDGRTWIHRGKAYSAYNPWP